MEKKSKVFGISLTPAQYRKLFSIAQAVGSNRNSAIGWLIDRAEVPTVSPIDLTQDKTATQGLGGRGSGFGN